jgi:hypothetical protein
MASKTLGSSKQEAVQGEGFNGLEPVETWLLSSVGALKATDVLRVRRSFCVDFELFIGAVQGGVVIPVPLAWDSRHRGPSPILEFGGSWPDRQGPAIEGRGELVFQKNKPRSVPSMAGIQSFRP